MFTTTALKANPNPQLHHPVTPSRTNPYRGYYSALLYFCIPLERVFWDVRADDFNRETADWRDDAEIHMYIRSFFDHMVCLSYSLLVAFSCPHLYQAAHLANNPTASCDDSFFLRLCVSAFLITHVLRLDRKARIGTSTRMWWLSLEPDRKLSWVRLPLYLFFFCIPLANFS